VKRPFTCHLASFDDFVKPKFVLVTLTMKLSLFLRFLTMLKVPFDCYVESAAYLVAINAEDYTTA